ncbi:membrane protein [Bombiscardovia nodaiensis]|uniref:Membrane protein n=1 Tax=Bombiscardovia nodaiensis TaxID=2932181 RepID=A0ABM8B6M3_9BIFI|nr:membrane protein [Bombiscardovia nodaiensis]
MDADNQTPFDSQPESAAQPNSAAAPPDAGLGVPPSQAQPQPQAQPQAQPQSQAFVSSAASTPAPSQLPYVPVAAPSPSPVPPDSTASQGGHGGFWSFKRFNISLLVALVVTLVLMFVFEILTSAASTPDLSYNSQNYDVTVLPNGDLRLKERYDMSLLPREDDNGSRPWRQLYQTYQINPKNLTGISDVSVRNVNDNQTYRRADAMPPDNIKYMSGWNEKYAGSWYMGVVDSYNSQTYLNYDYDPSASANPQDRNVPAGCDSGKDSCTVEFGWNIPETDKNYNLVFEIELTLHGVSTAYDDVTDFQWEPIGLDNQAQVGKLTGDIHLPRGANKDNSKAWFHYTGPSSSSWGDNSTLHFEADRVAPGTNVDIRAMIDNSLMKGVVRTQSGTAASRIADEENGQERSWRDAQTSKARTVLTAWIIVGLLILAAVVWLVYAAFSTFGQSRYRGEVSYWRQAPGMSPAAAAALSTVIYGGKKKLRSRQMASSVLSLANKRAIAIYPGPAQRYQGIDFSHTDLHALSQAMATKPGMLERFDQTSTIVIYQVSTDNVDSLGLCASESAALDILLKASESLQTRVFDLKQMQTAFGKDSEAYQAQEDFNNAVAVEFGSLAATRSREGTVMLEVLALVAAFGVWALGKFTNQMFLGWSTGGLLMLCSVFALCYGTSAVLTQEGQGWAGQVVGLRNYLTDFSSFADRGANDLVLWGTYLVYAAALGISKEAMKELAQAYPQVTDSAWLDSNADYPLIYMSYRPYGMSGGWANGTGVGAAGFDQSFVPDFSDLGGQLSSSFSDLQSTITAASSSGGSGGGFSGGGFGGSSGGSGGSSFGGR